MSTAAQLGREFDDSFASAPAPEEHHESLLAVRIGAQPYLLRLSELQGVTRAAAITSVPATRPELIGITAQRGRIVPVFDLASLLGRTGGAAPGWLVIAQGQLVAFAVDHIDGYVTVPKAAIRGTTVTHDGVRSIVPIADLVAAIVKKET